MSKNLKILIAVLVIVAVAVGGFLMTRGGLLEEADAFDLMKTSMMKNSEIKKSDQSGKISVSIDSQDEQMASVMEILNDVEFVFDVKQTLEPVKAEMDLGVVYQGEESLGMKMVFDDEKMIFNLPFMYDKPFYMTYEDYNNFAEESEEIPMQKIDRNEIMEKFIEFQEKFYSLEGIEGAENLDVEKYETIMRENLEGILIKGDKINVVLTGDENDTIECQEIILAFNDAQAMEFILPLLEEAKDDEAMKNVVISKMRLYMDFVKTIYDDEFYTYLQIDDPYKEIEEQINEIENNYQLGIEEVIAEIKELQETKEDALFTYISSMAIDEDGYLRYLDMDMAIFTNEMITSQMEGMEGMPGEQLSTGLESLTYNIEMTVNSINEDLEFNNYDNLSENGENLVNLMRNPESQEVQSLMMQIGGKLMQEVGTNPLLQRIAEEAGVY